MTTQDKNAPVNLSSWHHNNWVPGVAPEPPAILNRNTTLHAAIAWAWGEVALLDQVCMSEAADHAAVLGVVAARLPAIEAMLDELAKRTRHMAETMAQHADAAQPASS